MSSRTLLLTLSLCVVAAPMHAVTLRDLIELSKAGLSDDVLVALIDADRTIFTLDAEQIVTLKKGGVREAVLLKMLRSRREFEPAPEPARESAEITAPTLPEPEPPQVVVIGAPAPPPVVVVPQYYFPMIWGRPSHEGAVTPQPTVSVAPQPFLPPDVRGFGRFINDGWRGRP